MQMGKGCGYNREGNPAAHGKVVKQSKAAKSVQKSRKKAKKGEKEHEPAPPGFKPLSVLAESYPEFEDGAIEAHVRRGTRARQTENGIQGRVKRQLNSFFLYRKHFNYVAKEELKKAARATAGGKQKDGEPVIPSINPAVSKYVGFSWHHETQSLKARFQALAGEETVKHKLAEPNYLYKPKKPRKKDDSETHAETQSSGKARADSSDADLESIPTPQSAPQSEHSESRNSPLPGATGGQYYVVEQASSPYPPNPMYQHLEAVQQHLAADYQQHPVYQQQRSASHFQQADQELQACFQQQQRFHHPINQREYLPLTIDPRMCQQPEAGDPPQGLPSSPQVTGYADEDGTPRVGNYGVPQMTETTEMSLEEFEKMVDYR
ncbi:unnamed protein product [Clonostachys rosea]|uniref:HMG box domain-containing protein n=1 Tax=Bionectria ochroleuca TaxID=29856 RepID=A0ABY6TRD6_BIOOC|nr:unnamed protein product [Clonostachys rosea]